MSEEYKIKVNVPMFELGELETFDNNIHSIVEEYSKLMFKEKDQILTQRIIIKQEEEIERLKGQLEDYKDLSNEYNKLSEQFNKAVMGKINYHSEVRRLNNIINKAIEYILSHCEIIRYENEGIDKIGKVEGYPVLKILDKENK